MGLLVILMNFIDNVWLAAIFDCAGRLGGFLVVPMNALLQHRGTTSWARAVHCGAKLQRAGLHPGLGAFYSLSTLLGLSAFGAITAFGVVVAGAMWLIQLWHVHNCRHHREELEHLLQIARQIRTTDAIKLIAYCA
jgi:hypothetical protein